MGDNKTDLGVCQRYREGPVTRQESVTIRRLWVDWIDDKGFNNQACTDFYFEVVRDDRRVRHVNVFEVLDLVVNADVGLKESA